MPRSLHTMTLLLACMFFLFEGTLVMTYSTIVYTSDNEEDDNVASDHDNDDNDDN
jgi:hypothetical protein